MKHSVAKRNALSNITACQWWEACLFGIEANGCDPYGVQHLPTWLSTDHFGCECSHSGHIMTYLMTLYAAALYVMCVLLLSALLSALGFAECLWLDMTQYYNGCVFRPHNQKSMTNQPIRSSFHMAPHPWNTPFRIQSSMPALSPP